MPLLREANKYFYVFVIANTIQFPTRLVKYESL